MKKFNFMKFIQWDINHNTNKENSIKGLREFMNYLNYKYSTINDIRKDLILYKNENLCYDYYEKVFNGAYFDNYHKGNYFISKLINFYEYELERTFLKDSDNIKQFILKKIQNRLNNYDSFISPLNTVYNEISRTLLIPEALNYGYEVYDVKTDKIISISDIIDFESFLINNITELKDLDDEGFFLYIIQND